MYHYNAKIVAVYDGDTVTAVVDLGFNISFKMKLRLLGIDTPELRGADKIEGKRVRDIVRGMILDKQVEIKTKRDKTGKYGRYLATIFIDGLNLNQYLLDNNLAVPFMK